MIIFNKNKIKKLDVLFLLNINDKKTNKNNYKNTK